MQSKLPLLHSCPGGVRKSTFRGPWQTRVGTYRENGAAAREYSSCFRYGAQRTLSIVPPRGNQ